jgi:hypothetical protein
MSWVIVETNEHTLIRYVEVLGPFGSERGAEMARRGRHLTRVLELGAGEANNVKSVVREVIAP